MLFWRLAFRNLFRHRGRLFLNLILLVGAFATIVSFKGFKSHVLYEVQNAMINSQYGHIQIAKKSQWQNLSVDQATDKLLDPTPDLLAPISKIRGVQSVSGRKEFYGLINTEEKSVTAHFIGVQPQAEKYLQDTIIMEVGGPFQNPKETILSSGLKSKLKATVGQDVTVLSPTLTGSVNAMDLKITGLFSTGVADVDKGTIFLNLKDAQKILDTDLVDRLLIKLDDETEISRVLAEIKPLLQGTDLQAKGWRELAELYNQVEQFYQFQNFFIEMIILLLLLLSVANTVTMTVFERHSEIGTLRALGDYESDVQNLFLIESFLLGLLAVILAIPISYLLIQFVSGLNIPIMLPLASQPIPFKLIPTLGAYFEASAVCIFAVVLASLWPARKAARVSIVTALSAKI